MKKLLLVLLLIPTAALAADKDVVVTNTVGVDVQSLPDDSLVLGLDYQMLNLECITGVATNSCESVSNPDNTRDKLVHTVTLSLLADPGHRCQAEVFLQDIRDNGFSLMSMLKVYANGTTPAATTLSFPRPIRIEDRDGFVIRLREVDGLNNGCETISSIGVEIP